MKVELKCSYVEVELNVWLGGGRADAWLGGSGTQCVDWRRCNSMDDWIEVGFTVWLGGGGTQSVADKGGAQCLAG